MAHKTHPKTLHQLATQLTTFLLLTIIPSSQAFSQSGNIDDLDGEEKIYEDIKAWSEDKTQELGPWFLGYTGKQSIRDVDLDITPNAFYITKTSTGFQIRLKNPEELLTIPLGNIKPIRYKIIYLDEAISGVPSNCGNTSIRLEFYSTGTKAKLPLEYLKLNNNLKVSIPESRYTISESSMEVHRKKSGDEYIEETIEISYMDEGTKYSSRAVIPGYRIPRDCFTTTRTPTPKKPSKPTRPTTPRNWKFRLHLLPSTSIFTISTEGTNSSSEYNEAFGKDYDDIVTYGYSIIPGFGFGFENDSLWLQNNLQFDIFSKLKDKSRDHIFLDYKLTLHPKADKWNKLTFNYNYRYRNFKFLNKDVYDAYSYDPYYPYYPPEKYEPVERSVSFPSIKILFTKEFFIEIGYYMNGLFNLENNGQIFSTRIGLEWFDSDSYESGWFVSGSIFSYYLGKSADNDYWTDVTLNIGYGWGFKL